MAAEDLVPNAAVNKKVVWIPGTDPEAAGITVPSAGWSRNPTANVINMINGRDGVNRKRTYFDSPNISVSGFYDKVDWAPNITFTEGDSGFLKLYYTETQWVRETAILDSYTDDPGNPGDPHMINMSFARRVGTSATNGTDA
jgi:hypothetical protein